ncbi:hypothetical protein BLOT_014258 [Blomia tropicalis]|nr:hypothetical protein BLOT_014258 [Blomia tropicalis]
MNCDPPNNLSELYSSILQTCAQLDQFENLSNTEEQVNYLYFSKELDLDNLINERVFYLFDDHQKKHSAKKLGEAMRHKEFANMYASMVEPTFVSKALPNLNQAIINAPHSETSFLYECFLARANEHLRSNDHQSALLDIERGLQFKTDSIDGIEKKIALLKHLNRSAEAYLFVDQIIHSSSSSSFSIKNKDKLIRFRKELKEFKKAAKKVIDSNIDIVDCSSQEHLLEVDKRIDWSFNELTDQYYLESNELIPPDVTILTEEPILYVVRPESFRTHCNWCHVKCGDTCWPCNQCNEIIFCSESCAIQAHLDFHPMECGVLGALLPKSDTPTKILQVYRHLVQIGHKQLLKLDKRNVDSNLKRVPDLKTKLTRLQALTLFAECNQNLRERISNRRSRRSSWEIANAIYILIVYCYKSDIKMLPIESALSLIRILATEIMKVACNEYGWFEHDVQNDNNRINLGNYQCLVGSRIGHSCSPNVEWKFNGKRFEVVTIRPIEVGQELTITFVNGKSIDLWTRLSQVRTYMRLCRCDQCVKQSRGEFTFRCTNCNGPIPFDENHFTHLECLYCELPFGPGLEHAKSIYNRFNVLKRCIWLLHDHDSPDEHLQVVEERLSTMIDELDIYNRQLLNIIDELCETYISRKMYKMAVGWHHWLSSLKIDLTTNMIDESEHNNLVRLHKLDQWTLAYTELIESDPDNGTQFYSSGNAIFQEMIQLFGQVAETSWDIYGLNQDHIDGFINNLKTSIEKKWNNFKNLKFGLKVESNISEEVSGDSSEKT